MKRLSIDTLEQHLDEPLGTSDWVTVDQEMIDSFAITTDDSQWLHVDKSRAANGPFGGTIAHGFLTLSIVPRMLRSIYEVEGLAMTANYGLNRVRFPLPVRSGSRLRTHAKIVALEQMPTHSQLTIQATVEVEGETKPACVADLIMRLTPAAAVTTA